MIQNKKKVITKLQKKTEMETFPFFCVIPFETIRILTNLDQLSMSKCPSEPQSCER